MIRSLILAACLAVSPAWAQDWSGAGLAMQRDLTGGQPPLQSYFFPDAGDPATASRALGVAYLHIPGSAGSASIHVGLFENAGGAWRLRIPADGIGGFEPREPQVSPDGFFVTTSTLGPDDPRCCPSEETRWFVSWADGSVRVVE